MKFASKILGGVLFVYLTAMLLLGSNAGVATSDRVTGRSTQQNGPLAGQSEGEITFYVSEPVASSLSPAVRDLPIVAPEFELDREVNPRHNPLLLDENMGAFDISGRGPDPLLATSIFESVVPPLNLSFEGMHRSEGGGFSPPDTIGDIGPNHYVQMVNVAFSIYDRSGLRLSGPTPVNQLFSGVGGSCETGNWGDPVVVYDGLADRWLLSQFNSGNRMCVAISQTGDPTGAYHRYAFALPQFPDYFKFGVWPDGYYMSANEGSYTAYAFDRDKMLNGQPATFQRFSGHNNLFLPSDLDGPTPPPAGSPNYFYTFKDGAFHGGVDRLEVWAFSVDFATPANTTFTLAQSLPVAPFNFTVCGFFNFNCIQQLGTGQRVDAVSEWPMWRLPYRNFGTHETLIGNFSVDVSGSQQAGIRWFELRKLPGGNWTLHQEGTHAPDGHSRWMGSMAMDQDGNIALGYSVSSTALHPAIRYTVRMANDPLGTLRPEATLIAGGGSQTSGNRWGDYSAMSIDPLDDCTFWYTNEYYISSGTSWRTRVGTFTIPGCGGPGGPSADVAIAKAVQPATVTVGDNATFNLTVTNHGPETADDVVATDTLPAGVSYVSATPSQGSCQHNSGVVTCNLDDLDNQATASVAIEVTAVQSGQWTNTAVVNSATNDPNPGNNLASAVLTVNAAGTGADMAISMTAAPDPVEVNNNLTYSLLVTNLGPQAASNVMVVDTLPPGVTFVSATASQGRCGFSGGAVTCRPGNMANQATATITIVVKPTQVGDITNTATVTADQPDPNSGNNSATVTTTVIDSGGGGGADMALTMTAAPNPVPVGQTLTYDLVVTNLGSDNATQVIVSNMLPANVNFVSATASQGRCRLIGSEVDCRLGNMANQATIMVTIRVVPTQSGDITNTATVSADQPDPNPGNNSASVTVGVE